MSKWKDEIKSPTQPLSGGEPSKPNYIIQSKNPNFTYDNIETLISAYVEPPPPPKVDLNSLEAAAKLELGISRRFNFGAKGYLQKLTSFLNGGTDKVNIKTIECSVYDKGNYEDPIDQITGVSDGKEMGAGSSKEQKTFTLPRIEINKSLSGTNSPTASATNATSEKPTTTTIATITPTPTTPSSNNNTTTSATNSNAGNNNYNDDTGFIKSGRERISSSHYSTEKSGSSGYYGSNLYSTSSVSVVEENIYSEPVTEPVKQQKGKAGPPTLVTGKTKAEVGQPNNERLAFALGPTKPTRNTKHKEIQCLESLKQSITNLENCLQHQQPEAPPLTSLPTMMEREKEVSLSDKFMSHHYTTMDSETSSSDSQIPRPIWPNDYDDLLMDINLDEFLLKNESSRKEQKRLTGHVNPIFERSSSDDDLNRRTTAENGELMKSLTQMTSQYEELISFHRTRDILEQIRGKLNSLLQQYTESTTKQHSLSNPFNTPPDDDLENNIVILRNDLDNYLKIMNEQSENEIKVFCDGLSRNTKMLTMRNALNNKNTGSVRGESVSAYGAYYSENEYEIYDTIRKYQSSSLRMPRDSIVVDDGFTLAYDDKINPFMHLRDGREKCKRSTSNALPLPPPPLANHYENCEVNCKQCDASAGNNNNNKNNKNGRRRTYSQCCCENGDDCSPYISDLNQMQQNLSIQGIMLMNSLHKKSNSDKEKILLEYHKNKPSIWEMYYGANRTVKPHQTLIRKIKLGGKHALSISYPSTRPESDFTLDVPRAEQLKIKMQQEKQFRHRCRITIYLLSLIVFLAIVMIVSLILTRGKRMFGSMI